MLILLHVEGAVVVPAKGHRILQSLEAVVVSTPVSTVAHCRVTVRDELVVVGTESLPGVVSTLVQDDDHEGSHKEGCIALLGVVEGCVVVDLVVLILLVAHKFLKLLAKQVHFSEIKRAEISKEWLVNQIIVDAEVKGVLPGLGWILVTDPVETARNDLNRLVGLVAATRCCVLFSLHGTRRFSATIGLEAGVGKE